MILNDKYGQMDIEHFGFNQKKRCFRFTSNKYIVRLTLNNLKVYIASYIVYI